ncbi:MAG: CoA transferase [Acidimicrobiales bacterium]|nr:CoA transferase [Acidimicrobiales bacterium]MCB1258964.1 CoA transferase [Acidimicrobiales bacterium]
MPGPLHGVKVIELAGLGPAPFAAMLLADMGADVVTVERAGMVTGAPLESAKGMVYGRGRRSIGVDLKHPDGVGVVLDLCADADVCIEGFRPGVVERLGVGPDVVRARNERLVYGRMTGWGQDGPYADRAGHDINYIAVAGPLAHIGRAGAPPTPPLNLLGDFGGGGLLLAFGIVSALVERATSGLGQVVDAAMVDGAAILSAPIAPAFALGFFHAERGTNWLDSGAPYYDVYECADGRWLSIGAIEPQFYANLLAGLGLDPAVLPAQDDESAWPELKERFAAIVRTRTADEWMAVFDDPNNCVAPVRSFAEVLDDPHLAARGTYVDVDGVPQPAPAPRFDRTPATLDRPPAPAGHHTDEVLAEAGVDAATIAALRASGAVA